MPITLALAASLLSGTAAATVLRDHPFVIGTIITMVWLLATWHGLRLLQRR